MKEDRGGWGLSHVKRGLALLCVFASTACVYASAGKVRKASGTTLCVENMVVVVEVVENMGNRHIIEPLRGHLQARGVIGHMVDVESIADLRHPSISGPIGTHKPQAVLVIDWVDTSLLVTNLVASTSETHLKVSLYEYTQQQSLVEVWKSTLRSARALTAHVALEPKDGEAIAEELVEELGESKLIAPCSLTHGD